MKKRLFVGNLASDVREDELRERFGKFGHVENVELHTKKDEMGVPFRTFAYLDVGLTQEKLVNCIKTYHNAVWKGNNMVVQVAKESYIQKIRREAERLNRSENESDKNEANNNAWNGESSMARIKVEKTEDYSKGHRAWIDTSHVNKPDMEYLAKKLKGDAEVSPDEFSQQKSFLFDNLQDEEPQSFMQRPGSSRKTPSAFSQQHSWETAVNGDGAQSGQKWSVNSFQQEEAKTEWTSKRGSFRDVKSKRELGNERRLQSLKAKADQSKMQHRALKAAFSSLDSGTPRGNKKIVFGDSDDEEGAVNGEVGTQRAVRRRALFDEEDDEGDGYSPTQAEDDFRVRPQFQGKKGKKVWELQSRIGTDERFRLNEQFVESDDDEDDDIEEDADVDERTRNLKVLQDIVGGTVAEGGKSLQKKPIFKDTRKLRFDPTKEDASRFEVKKEVASVSRKKESKEPHPAESIPEVSKEQFYEVSSSLRDAFSSKNREGGKSFSFSQMFRQGDSDDSGEDPFLESDSDEDASKKQQHGKAVSGKAEVLSKDKRKGKGFEENPFKYDSSDEERPQRAAEAANVEDENLEHDGRFMVKVDPSRFFFVPGDHRLLEGVQFFKRHEDNDTIVKKWEAVRQNVYMAMMSKRKLARRAAERKYGKKKAWKVTQRK